MNAMPALKRLYTSFTAVVTFCSEASSILIILLMFLVTADVVGRYVFNSPIPGTLEIGESAMVFIVFLAYAHTEATGQHIRIQLIERWATPRQLQLLNVVACLAAILIYGVICWQAWGQAMYSLSIDQRMSGWLRLPLYPAKFVLVWGSFILVLQFIVSLSLNISKVFKS